MFPGMSEYIEAPHTCAGWGGIVLSKFCVDVTSVVQQKVTEVGMAFLDCSGQVPIGGSDVHQGILARLIMSLNHSNAPIYQSIHRQVNHHPQGKLFLKQSHAS